MPRLKRQRRLIFSIILLAITIVLFYSLGAQHGEFSANIPRSEMLDNLFIQPDGSSCAEPCMFGVYIGKTKPTDIPSILRFHPYVIKHFSASDLAKPYSDAESFQATTSDFNLEFWAQGTEIYGGKIGGKYRPYQGLKIIPSKEMPTLGQIIHTLGIPANVRFIQLPRNGQLDKEFFYAVGLTYPQKRLEISFHYLPDALMKPDDRPADMSVLAPDNNPSFFSEEGSWHGFQSIQDYIHRWDTVIHVYD